MCQCGCVRFCQRVCACMSKFAYVSVCQCVSESMYVSVCMDGSVCQCMGLWTSVCVSVC